MDDNTHDKNDLKGARLIAKLVKDGSFTRHIYLKAFTVIYGT